MAGNKIPYVPYGRMNPQLLPPDDGGGPSVLTHALARLLPQNRWQAGVYRYADKFPPGFEDGFSPNWEVVTASLPARQTASMRVSFQREFHLIALSGSSSQAGGFRAQVYDVKKKRRLVDRGIAAANFFGSGTAEYFFLREPYAFDDPSAQALVVVQNQDTGGANNLIQVVLYGVSRRFNFPD